MGERFQQLGAGEKRALAVLAVVLAAAALVRLAVFPLMDKASALDQRLSSQTAVLEEVTRLAARMEAVRQAVGAAKSGEGENPAGDFTLFSFLEKLADQNGIKGNIVFLRPSASDSGTGRALSIVEIRFQNISMANCVAFLLGVETAPAVWVRRFGLSLSAGEDGLLDVTLETATPKS